MSWMFPTWICKSCGWVNDSPPRCDRGNGNNGGRPPTQCRNCSTKRGARKRNVSIIVGEAETKPFANLGPYRHRHNGQLVTTVQTYADGTAWG